MDPFEEELHDGLRTLALRAPEPSPEAPVANRRDPSGQRMAVAAAALVLLVVASAVVWTGTRPSSPIEMAAETNEPGASRPAPSPVPPSVGDVLPGSTFDGVPPWLREFVATRGGVDQFPVLANAALDTTSVGVFCPVPLPAGVSSAPSRPLNDTTDCTFVLEFENESWGNQSVDVCLRSANDQMSACSSDSNDAPISVPNSELEMVVFRRNDNFDPASLVVVEASDSWDQLDVMQSGFLTWRTS